MSNNNNKPVKAMESFSNVVKLIVTNEQSTNVTNSLTKIIEDILRRMQQSNDKSIELTVHNFLNEIVQAVLKSDNSIFKMYFDDKEYNLSQTTSSIEWKRLLEKIKTTNQVSIQFMNTHNDSMEDK